MILKQLLVLSTVYLVSLQAQSIEEDFTNPCKGETCGECIQTSPVCAWCEDEVFPRGKKRCNKYKNHVGKCKDISFPNSFKGEVTDNKWTSGDTNNPPVQVRPQAMDLTLRPNEPFKFKLLFQQQANYPVDLYFLLDLSYGMVRQKEAQERLIALGNDIRDIMANITNNFKLGFGTFVDKLLMPYTAWTDTMLKNRCPLETGECAKPHDYKNQVNLGEDAEGFASKMRSALEAVSQSIDDAEGGMDGLIQALDCDIIGWRTVSRRIIVYSSNSLFHLAGAGKLGGATKHSDLSCDLRSDGTYRGEKIYDYPSVSQLASKLKEKKANVIFAVMKDVSQHYKELQQFMDEAVVAELEADSANIVQLIRDQYDELRSRIQFESANVDFIDVKFKSKCLGNVMEETNLCQNLKIKDRVEFDVTLSVNPKICEGQSGLVSKNVSIDAVGLNEKLDIQLTVLCACECETKQNRGANTKCSNEGTLECGICDCNAGRYGKQCQCDASEITNEESLEKCRMEPEESNVTCSGNGECVCGDCVCYTLPNNPEEFYSEEFCQCNDHICPYAKNGEMCSGPQQGVCKCGNCVCLDGWSSADCSCTTDNSSCMAKVETEDGQIKEVLCNGVGECNCGKCKCREDSGMVGPSCEECLTCNTKCSEYRECALCVIKKSLKDCKSECGTSDAEAVSTLPEGKVIRPCEGIDSADSCKYYFTYQYSADNDIIIKAQKTKKCPQEAPVMAIVGGTVAAVVLIPLLIICLVIFLRNKRDAKEFAEFMKEQKKAKWDSGSNPIYKDPNSTFQNPTYKGGK